MTVQSNVPIVSREVQVEEYRYYRFFVDRPGQGLTASLALDTGDADLFVSFEQERPNASNAQFSDTGQVGCQTVPPLPPRRTERPRQTSPRLWSGGLGAHGEQLAARRPASPPSGGAS